MKLPEFENWLAGVFLSILAIGCGGDGDGDGGAGSGRAEAEIKIECHFYYRPTTRASGGEAKQVTIEVPFVDGPVPEIALDITRKVEFDGFSCAMTAAYNSLSIHISGADAPISAMLYQFGKVPENGMSGGHGFTGLHYFYRPGSEAELQFWAEVKEPGESSEVE